jgi:hypothetical protein
MANKVKIEKDIYVKDKYGVRRHAFIAGDEVDESFYNLVLSTDTPVNPDDLPKAVNKSKQVQSISSRGKETKVDAEPQVEVSTSEDGGVVERQRVDEAEGAELAVEATAKVAEGEPTRAEGPVSLQAEKPAKAVEAEEAEAKPKAEKSKKGNK